MAYATSFEREETPISALKVGLKCGGSDGLSGITANPLIGAFSDRLIEAGVNCINRGARNVWCRNHFNGAREGQADL